MSHELPHDSNDSSESALFAALADVEAAMQREPSARTPQRRLAEEVTRAVHGDGALSTVQQDAALRFGGVATAESLQQVTPVASCEPRMVTVL